MKIGQIAKQTGVSVQAIRLYEQKGLIAPATRTASGYRDYPPSALDDVRAIKQGQRLGFTLSEMKEFVELQQSPVKTHQALGEFVRQKSDQLNHRINQMMVLRDALMRLSVGDYDWNADGDCPITSLLASLHYQEEKAVTP